MSDVYTYVKGKLRRRPTVQSTCVRCGQPRTIRADSVRAMCGRCQRVLAGIRSFQLKVQRIGYEAAIGELRDLIDQHPSPAELEVRRLLDLAGLNYRTNVILWTEARAFIVDFEIELDGQFHWIELDGVGHRIDPRMIERDAKLRLLVPEVQHVNQPEHVLIAIGAN